VKLRVEGNGPLVVKLAGAAGGVGLYHEEVGAARAAGYRVAELDLSGDRRDDPAPAPLSWDSVASEVARALDRLDARRAVLWGTSFGSLVGLATAARYPERVRALLLCAPPEPGWRPRFPLLILRHASTRRRPARVATRWFNLGFALRNGWDFFNPSALARLPALARASWEARTPASTIHAKLCLLFHDHPGLPDPERKIPCSIIAGAWDTVTSPGASRRLAAMLPGSRLHRLRFAGHSCAYSRPRSYARRVLEELRRLSESSRAGGAGRSPG
jgi:pimeloyl-ACP methyl ester carboxylesterase